MIGIKKTSIDEVLARASEEIISRDISDNKDAREIIEEIVFYNYPDLEVDDLIYVIDRVYGKLRGELGPVSYLLDRDDVSEIMINGPEEIFIERDGILELTGDKYDSEEELEQVIRRIAASVRREINEMSPILDARLSDGSRVNAVLKNIALDGPSMTVRKFRRRKITLDEMIFMSGISEEAAEDLKRYVEAGYNIFVSGGTSSGKTTFLNALSDYIPDSERVVTIEDSAELQMNNIENIVRMECRNSNASGKGIITMEMLIKTSLRMRPDRIIVGEVRGREVSDMLQALNTGHSGMSTGHGNSVRGMLRRLEAMYIAGSEMPLDAVRAQIIEGIDIIVQLARLRNGDRKVVEISEILGYGKSDYEINTLYELNDDLKLSPTGNGIVSDMKLKLMKSS